jgi:hypothetical protein
VLRPGHSGAPVFDDAWRVVGIGNGGLEAGLTQATWASPSAALDDLLASSEPIAFTADILTQLETSFGAELDAAPGRSIDVGTQTFRAVRTRGLNNLLEGSDDPKGVVQLVTGFGQMTNFNVFVPHEYEVFQTASGAAVAFPVGAELLTRNGRAYTESPDGNLKLIVATVETTNARERNEAIEAFRRELMGDAYATRWMRDPAWSYPQPRQTVDGFYIDRASYIRDSATRRRGVFMTVAAYRSNLLLVAAKNHDVAASWAPDRIAIWAQYVVATQLATFAQKTVGQTLASANSPGASP